MDWFKLLWMQFKGYHTVITQLCPCTEHDCPNHQTIYY